LTTTRLFVKTQEPFSVVLSYTAPNKGQPRGEEDIDKGVKGEGGGALSLQLLLAAVVGRSSGGRGAASSSKLLVLRCRACGCACALL